MEKDVIFETAEKYVKATGRSVFLTGKAGTGKTTFLKYITSTTAKRLVVLAPTGVAAINAGGSTIHSFFQLPLCPYLPDVKELVTEYQMPERYRGLKKERIKIIRTLDLLVIDEISMVRADLLDAVDMTLRKYRYNDKPFGGVQLLMIGDAQQLSPVVKEDERQYMSQVYKSPYFFHSKALQKLDYVTIELQKVHRQKDQDFLDILNAVRENKITYSLLDKLNSRVGAECAGIMEGKEPIRLTTHNAQADAVNARRLAALKGRSAEFIAEIEGEFPENTYPAEENLILKPGAQVMFLRNDPDGMYYNGKIGKITDVFEGMVTVSDDEGHIMNVTPVEWCNSQYVLDDASGEIRQNVVGTFRQLPLRIAWAITIHKSQGLTFENVIIDAGSAFAFGQVYVALSRCRSLEGISLETPIVSSAIYTDVNVSEFNDEMPSAQIVCDRLLPEVRHYSYEVLRELFDLDIIERSFAWLLKVWRDKLKDVYVEEYQRLLDAWSSLKDASEVAATFRNQLSRIEMSQLSDDSYLKERLVKAAGYFRPIMDNIRDASYAASDLEIDNKEVKKKAKQASDEVLTFLDIISRSLEYLSTGEVSVEQLCRIRTECFLEDRTQTKKRRLRKVERKEGAPGMVNEALRDRLQQWRTARFKRDNVPAYVIVPQGTLLEIAMYVPCSKAELLSIKGFGNARFTKYGEEILEICREFADGQTKVS